MSDVYQSRTNQKLSFVRLHLQALEESLDGSAWSKHTLVESYNESVLFHLAGAADSYVKELAERYKLNVDQINSIPELVQAMAESSLESPEISEIEQLYENTGSWLRKLWRAYKACWYAEHAPQKQASEVQSVSEIHVLQINPDHAQDADVYQEYLGWFNALKELIERQRFSMLEY